jgi:hypothetical protein
MMAMTSHVERACSGGPLRPLLQYWNAPVDTCREDKYRSLFKPLLDSALLRLQDDPSLGSAVSN